MANCDKRDAFVNLFGIWKCTQRSFQSIFLKKKNMNKSQPLAVFKIVLVPPLPPVVCASVFHRASSRIFINDHHIVCYARLITTCSILLFIPNRTFYTESCHVWVVSLCSSAERIVRIICLLCFFIRLLLNKIERCERTTGVRHFLFEHNRHHRWWLLYV